MKQGPLSPYTSRSSLHSRPDQSQEYESTYLDLGSESPRSVLLSAIDGESDQPPRDEWAKSGIAVHTAVPTRNPLWTPSPLGRQHLIRKQKHGDLVDYDCGICFENAIRPCRTACCNRVFCTEHLYDWLYGPDSDGRCPSCRTTYTLPGPSAKKRTHAKASSREDKEGDDDTDSDDGDYRTPRISFSSPGSDDEDESNGCGKTQQQRLCVPSIRRRSSSSQISPVSVPVPVSVQQSARTAGASTGRGYRPPGSSHASKDVSRREFNQVLSLLGFTSVLLALRSYRGG